MNQQIKVAVDATVFAYHQKQLDVLLIQRKIEPHQGEWALPGGLILNDESLENAARRELKEEAGVQVDFMEQLYTFGNPKRDPRNRVIAVVYYALVSPQHHKLKADTDAKDARWWNTNNLPPLAFDHAEIIRTALERLRAKLYYQPIGFNLLEKEFPFSAVENLYTTVLGKAIDRRNFRKKFMQFGILEPTGNIHQEGSGRPAKMFRFHPEKYKKLEKEGFQFEIKSI